MIFIKLICVGKIKEAYLKDAIEEYSKRISKFAKLNIIEVKDEKPPQNTMDEIEKIVLEKQYKERIIDYRELDMKISDLECKAREAELSKLRLLDMSKNIGGQRLTVETLSKPIVNTCLQAIIVFNRHELVFVLPNNEKANYLYIKEKRASLVQHTPLLEGDVTLERRYRNEHLHYKVVMV